MERNSSHSSTSDTSGSSTPKLFSIADLHLRRNTYLPSIEPRLLKSNLSNGCKRLSTHLFKAPIARAMLSFRRDTPLSLAKHRKNVSFKNAVTLASPGALINGLKSLPENSTNGHVSLSDTSMRFFEQINQRSLPPASFPIPGQSGSWTNFCGNSEADLYRNKILMLDKQLIETHAQLLSMKADQQLQQEMVKSEMEAKQRKIDELDKLVATMREQELILNRNIDRLKDDNLLVTKNFEAQKMSHLREMNKLREELQSAQRNESKIRVEMYSEGDMLKHRVDSLQSELDKANKLVMTYADQLKQTDAQDVCGLNQVKADLEATKKENQELQDKVKEQDELKAEIDAELVEKCNELGRVKSLLKSVEENRAAEGNTLNNRAEIKKLKQIIEEKDTLIEAKGRQLEDKKRQLEISVTQRNDLGEKFQKLARNFRQTVGLLTGYQMSTMADTQYMLTHVDDLKKQRVLLFEMNKEKLTFKLLLEKMDPNWVESLREKIETYLTCEDGPSYPAFLASITLDLHHEKTLKKYNMI